jgi:hypothetical protein
MNHILIGFALVEVALDASHICRIQQVWDTIGLLHKPVIMHILENRTWYFYFKGVEISTLSVKKRFVEYTMQMAGFFFIILPVSFLPSEVSRDCQSNSYFCIEDIFPLNLLQVV